MAKLTKRLLKAFCTEFFFFLESAGCLASLLELLSPRNLKTIIFRVISCGYSL